MRLYKRVCLSVGPSVRQPVPTLPPNVCKKIWVGLWDKIIVTEHVQLGLITEHASLVFFSAHSTRCAAASKAATSITADIVLKTAGWTEESTFRRFYKKPVAITNQMSVAVLE